MTLIGMFHFRENPERVTKAYAYAAAAKAEGVPFFYFTHKDVMVEEERIIGKVYENGEWVEKIFPFPDVIYNAGAPPDDEAEEMYDFLSGIIPFTSHSVGNKLRVYNRIKEGREFGKYLIPTFELTDSDILFDMISQYGKVLLKPKSGHQGKGIITVEKKSIRWYQLMEAGNSTTYKKKKLLKWFSDHIQPNEYIAQPFLSCRLNTGHVYDLRLHVQKNGLGEWVITSMYPRIGPIGSVTSNMGSGGYTGYLDDILKKEFPDSWREMKAEVERFAIDFATYFESLYNDVLFDELGVDIGIDENQKLWLFEVNWRPGEPVIFNCELDVARNTILYAKYLAEREK
ncbi:YheC/YheD family protein [Domibacillus iocasae]|uniref:Alpha-L-glutamate ligase n=1 Tax=Domibacillus iocasae TaxID=1714016 RepID=A0A1E7DUA1_9BACI|nr:YheC/YheD family protein [Domibacillus iocasae]OES46595.1 alpha-L-glutamate ligase [Domibacillus iocasae]